jgi:hypothetical protein
VNEVPRGMSVFERESVGFGGREAVTTSAWAWRTDSQSASTLGSSCKLS